MILLDTNVLIYASGGDHPLKAPCRAIMDGVSLSRLRACVTDSVLAEFLHARARRTSRLHAARLTADIIGIVDDVLSPDQQIRTRALDLFGRTQRLSSSDATIAATALHHDLTLVSADLDFGEVPGLRVITPESADMQSMLAT